MTKVESFLKNNFIFVIAFVVALVSCFFVPPDSEYANYFEINTLACIFLLLLVIAGLSRIQFFEKVARIIVKKFKNTRSIIMCLIFVTYVSAMVNANDMSLLTFLPLSYIVLKYTGNLRYLAFTFIMQNIASNLGGMITPIGNPQNLYIFSFYQMNLLDFFKIMALPTLFALILIVVVCLFIKKQPLEFKDSTENKFDAKRAIVYGILFVLTILVVVRVIPWWLAFAIILITMLFCDKQAFLKVDYTIPMIFVFFFIFSGNMARIPAVTEFLQSMVAENTYLTAFFSCQLISNVPTAVLLSKFTMDYASLLVAVNVASLGIIFSSLSGVIALKEYMKFSRQENFPKKKGAWHYIKLDLVFNVVGALILVPLCYFTLFLF
ncbi:MAG: citrate transporter [Clostridia bacterium]|nr:citrate transporter [Clostridia bacterium]